MSGKDSWDDSSDDEEEMQPVVKYNALQFVLEPELNKEEAQPEETQPEEVQQEEAPREEAYYTEEEDADQSDWEEDYDELDAYDRKLGRYVRL